MAQLQVRTVMQSACTESKWTKILINVVRVDTSNTVHSSRHNLMSINAKASCIMKIKVHYSAAKRIKLQQPTVVLRVHTIQLKMRAAGDRMQGIGSMRGSGAVCTNSKPAAFISRWSAVSGPQSVRVGARWPLEPSLSASHGHGSRISALRTLLLL